MYRQFVHFAGWKYLELRQLFKFWVMAQGRDGQEGFFWPLLGGRIAQRCWCPMCPVSEDHGSTDKSCEECQSNSVIWKKFKKFMCCAFFCPTFCWAALHIVGTGGMRFANEKQEHCYSASLGTLQSGSIVSLRLCWCAPEHCCFRGTRCAVEFMLFLFELRWGGILQCASWHQRLIQIWAFKISNQRHNRHNLKFQRHNQRHNLTL